jgi:hypothetical protein
MGFRERERERERQRERKKERKRDRKRERERERERERKKERENGISRAKLSKRAFFSIGGRQDSCHETRPVRRPSFPERALAERMAPNSKIPETVFLS